MVSTRVKVMVAVVTLVVLGGVATLALPRIQFPSIGYNNGYQPLQPIPYDHSLHAGKYQIPCLYCHHNADKSKHASVPSANVCMNCHTVVKTDSPHIQRLAKYYEQGGRIPWTKVHMLPDHAHFNHQPHVLKGVSCQTCHGPIEEMTVVYQHADLSMGWCIECHRKPEVNASINCSTCHY